jgi:hypothetical protein
VIDTALGDQGIAEARLSTPRQHLGAQRTRPLPAAWTHFLPVMKRCAGQLHVLTAIASEEGDPHACAGRDHRSAFSSASVCVNRTLPWN